MDRSVVAATGLAILVAGCSADEKTTVEAPTETAAAADLTPETGTNIAALWGGGKAVPIDLQFAHPNGTVLQLTSLQSKPTETIVGVIVINGDEREVSLNRYPNNRNSYLVAGDGQKLYLSPPAANTQLAVQPGQRMQGELVFLGRLPKDQVATLVLNEGRDSNQYTNTPGYRLDLPLKDAAFSDDGSKKN